MDVHGAREPDRMIAALENRGSLAVENRGVGARNGERQTAEESEWGAGRKDMGTGRDRQNQGMCQEEGRGDRAWCGQSGSRGPASGTGRYRGEDFLFSPPQHTPHYYLSHRFIIRKITVQAVRVASPRSHSW